jgi:hypothetical protein
MGGLQSGAQLLALQDARAERERLAQEAAAKQAAAEAMQAEMAAVADNPTRQGVVRLMTKYPSLSENYKRVLDAIDPDEKQLIVNAALPIDAAFDAGDTKLAIKRINDTADALINTGREKEGKALKAIGESAAISPNTAKFAISGLLASAIGAENYLKLRKAPGEIREGEAKATAQEIKTKYAESEALLDLEKKGWDVKKIVSDINISKENARIAAMNAAANREANDLKRQELLAKVEDAKLARDEKVREKAASASAVTLKLDNMLEHLDRALSTPSSVVDRVAGPLVSRSITVTQEGSDFEQLLETIGSQAFLSQVDQMRGLGAMTEREGQALRASFQNLSLRQSPKQLRANLAKAKAMVESMRKAAMDKYGVPTGSHAEQSAPSGGAPSADDLMAALFGGQ